jgi:SAM-dependent methyltransferase
VAGPRYDGEIEWYESFASGEMFSEMRDFAAQFLGAGPGHCLDLGCGTGRAIPSLVAAGWSVIGIDVSGDQLAAARKLIGDSAQLVQGDAHALPFVDDQFDAVISILTHTDLDDVLAVFTETFRVVRTGGVFVYVGLHPCFASPFVARERAETIEGAVAVLVPGYRDTRWHRLPSDTDDARVRARVGINHLPLAGLLNSIIASGFAITAVEEPGDADPPIFLGIRATKY